MIKALLILPYEETFLSKEIDFTEGLVLNSEKAFFVINLRDSASILDKVGPLYKRLDLLSSKVTQINKLCPDTQTHQTLPLLLNFIGSLFNDLSELK